MDSPDQSRRILLTLSPSNEGSSTQIPESAGQNERKYPTIAKAATILRTMLIAATNIPHNGGASLKRGMCVSPILYADTTELQGLCLLPKT